MSCRVPRCHGNVAGWGAQRWVVGSDEVAIAVAPSFAGLAAHRVWAAAMEAATPQDTIWVGGAVGSNCGSRHFVLVMTPGPLEW